MRELSLHILDLAQNSIEAGAHHVQIDINENEDGYFTFAIADDGRGMTEEMVKKVRDPFVTTRITRKVGMGIPFKAANLRLTRGKCVKFWGRIPILPTRKFTAGRRNI